MHHVLVVEEQGQFILARTHGNAEWQLPGTAHNLLFQVYQRKGSFADDEHAPLVEVVQTHRMLYVVERKGLHGLEVVLDNNEMAGTAHGIDTPGGGVYDDIAEVELTVIEEYVCLQPGSLSLEEDDFAIVADGDKGVFLTRQVFYVHHGTYVFRPQQFALTQIHERLEDGRIVHIASIARCVEIGGVAQQVGEVNIASL